MKERPILFSAPMVRAILEGRKTQTRRILKPQPVDGDSLEIGTYAPTMVDRHGDEYPGTEGWGASNEYECIRCPYGKPRDQMWVREAWKTGEKLDQYNATAIADMAADAGYENGPAAPLLYPATGDFTKWGDNDKSDFGDWGRYRHPRFMPRWASRITLEITGVRVQRLLEITEEDAQAEGAACGCTNCGETPCTEDCFIHMPDYRDGFAHIWMSINGQGSWGENPWVWVLTFKRIEAQS